MKRQVVYVMSYPAHLPYLVVSLWTLRQHYDGEIVVYAWSESYELVKRIAEDERLEIKVVLFNPEHKGRNSQFECKQQVMMTLDTDVGLYLDADTIIGDKLDLLFERVEMFGFVGTQFCGRNVLDWKIANTRLSKLREVSGIDQDVVEKLLSARWPSVNGGVFACKPSSPVLPLWHEWTKLIRDFYISDEVMLHVMMVKFGPSMEMTVIMENGIYNCSPYTNYFPKEIRRDDKIKVWHFHGDCNVRPDRSAKGVGLWWPVFCDVVKENAGGIGGWYKEVGNKHLTKLYERLSI